MRSASSEPNARRGIQSLEIGVRLFQDIHRLGRPATLNEVARLSGMPPSKAHRYCVSLIRTGLLQRDGRGLYGIGPFGFQLSHAEADRDHARVVALAALRDLVDQTGETGFLSTWGQKGPTILDVADAPKPISIRPTTKGDLPLLNTTAGWVFAAYLEAEMLKPLLDAELDAQRRSLKLSAAEIASMRQAFMRRLIDVRRRRLARGTGERHPGLNAFSAPIFDRQGRVALVITMFGLAATFSSAWDGPLAQALQVSAAELTRRIGGAAPTLLSPSPPTARRG